MSNRIRFAVHHGANVHLIPWDQLDAVAVAPVADEARLRVCALGRAVGHAVDRGGFAGGGDTAKMSVITSRLTANLEVFTIKTEVFTNPARFHCFPSRFDHRVRGSVGSTRRVIHPQYHNIHNVYNAMVFVWERSEGPTSERVGNYVDPIPGK